MVCGFYNIIYIDASFGCSDRIGFKNVSGLVAG